MKRRDFLVASAGIAGGILPPLASSQTKPCPPPTLSVDGGQSVSTSCAGGTELADWQARSVAPGVVWAHNFERSNEVDQFRWQGGIGSVPNIAQSDGNTRWATDGFAGGGCLEINIPAGGTCKSSWWRPLSALQANGNGLTAADAGANGTLQRRVWSPSSTFDASWNFRNGYWGHSDYHSQYATWQGQSNVWDGTDFYLQMRVKMPARRWDAVFSGPGSANPPGKLLYIDVTGVTGVQEVLVRSPARYGWTKGRGAFEIYTSMGNYNQSYLGDPQGNSTTAARQPGGDFASTCRFGGGAQTCWEFPADQWVTLLFHIIPGRHNNIDLYSPTWFTDAQHKDHGIEVWAAKTGETSYTKIWSKTNYAWYYDSNGRHPPAFNAIAPSGYMNNVNATTGWYQRYTQMILSKQFIPCPQV
jgi:hypothetical protein